MGGPAMDCLANPLGAVRSLFAHACESSATVPDATFGRSDWGVKELFEDFLFRQGNISRVPEINAVPLDSIPVKNLVRYRGMVQDMFNAEYYIGACKDGLMWHTTKFTDVADIPVEEALDVQVWDRRLLYCVPVPGENKWLKQALSSTDAPNFDEPLQTGSVTRSEKRLRQEESEAMVLEDSTWDESNVPKRMREENGTIADAAHNLSMLHGDSKFLSCLVKVYDGVDEDIKLNDVVDFVGILTFDPELSFASDSDCFVEDDACQQLPASVVPRVHCITLRKLSSHKIFATLPTVEAEHASVMTTSAAVLHVRQLLLQGLQNLMGGDNLAAEYLLLHLLSKVHTRVDSMAVGKLSLNIVIGDELISNPHNVPLTTAVAEAISVLLPCSCVMPLSLEFLNENLISPRKDYTANRLVTGALQLPVGAHLLLDETALTPGKLTSIGLQNVESLKMLLESQKVEYDFEYYKLEMPSDIRVLIMSQAKSGLLAADAVVNIRPKSCSSFLMDDSDLDKCRFFLNYVMSMEHSMEPSMQEVVQEDLVQSRQHDRSLTPETFHRWLTMARLMALSYGSETLGTEHWRRVREMELLCAERNRGE